MNKNFIYFTLLFCMSSAPVLSADVDTLVSGDTNKKSIEKPIQDYFPGKIYLKLAQALGTTEKDNPFNPVESEKKLTELTEGRSLVLKLTLSPKGRVVGVEVLKGS